MQIDHNPNEPKIDRSNTVFYVAWAGVLFVWIVTFLTQPIEWQSVGLGVISAAVLIISVTEKYGNKLPRR